MNNHLIKEIPYIDIQELLTGYISSESFLSTLHQYGFVYFYNLEASPFNLNSLQFKKLESCAQNFFSLPLQNKMKYYIGQSPNHRGYVPITEKGAYGDEKNRIYEAFDMSYSLKNANKKDYQKLRGENIWPQEISQFRDTCESYYNKMFFLGKCLLQIFAKSFDLSENYFEKFIKYPPAQLRLLHYQANESFSKKEDVAMGAHTDYECFTLLYQTSPGIQGYIENESQFFNLPVFKNSLLMVVGDMLHFMTNGYLKSFYHRVINNGSERYSFPFFMNLDFETKIKVLPKFQSYRSPKSATDRIPHKVVVGHHLLGQLYRDFPYIKEKIDRGDWAIPFKIPQNNIFEQGEKNG